MVARDGGSFGPHLKGKRGVKQGDLLSPTIFNMVVDTVLCHWVTMVTEMEETSNPITWGFGRDIQNLVAYLYADNRLLVSTRSHWLHRAFDVLTEMFDPVGLHINARKTVSMALQPCYTIGGHSTEAYSLRMTGEGLT